MTTPELAAEPTARVGTPQPLAGVLPATGWYAVALADDLTAGVVVSTRAGGAELVVYRAESGTVYAADALCPRRGFPLGDAEVLGEDLRSTVDGWTWGPSGITRDDQGVDRGDSGLVLGYHPACEVAGLVLVSGAASEAELADLVPQGLDLAAPAATQRIETDPVAVLENLADPLSLGCLLGGAAVLAVQVVSSGADGPLRLRCSIEESVTSGSDTERTVEVAASGPGLVTVEEPGRGRVLFAVTPVASSEIEVRTVVWTSAEPVSTDFDWAGLAERQIGLLAATRTPEATELAEPEREAFEQVWAWSAAKAAGRVNV